MAEQAKMIKVRTSNNSGMVGVNCFVLVEREDVEIIHSYFREQDDQEGLSCQDDLLWRLIEFEQLVFLSLRKGGDVLRIKDCDNDCSRFMRSYNVEAKGGSCKISKIGLLATHVAYCYRSYVRFISHGMLILLAIHHKHFLLPSKHKHAQ
jgi:hypothetical protein